MKNIFLASTVAFIMIVSSSRTNAQTFTANFTGCDSGYAPLCITFTDASTSSAGNPINTWHWTFQGGSPATSTIANPYVCFNSAGTYSVSLTVTTVLGSSKTVVSSNCAVVLSGTSVNENNLENQISIYPNPFSSQAIFQMRNFLYSATLTVDNYLGQTVVQINNISGQTITFSRDNLPGGLYYIRLIENNRLIAADKLMIIDK